MRGLAWLPLLAACLALPPLLLAGDSGGRAEYIGGTVAALPSKTEGSIQLTSDDFFLFQSEKQTIRVRYDRINTLEYGQRVNRRYAEAVLISPVLLLAKRRKHYLTVGYQDENGEQQAMVFEVHKNAVRTLLVGLEARTGQRIEYQDEEARKAGKG